MNKKMTVKTETGVSTCVLSDGEDFDAQLMRLYGFTKGHGMWAGIEDGCVKVQDYFVDETLASFPILSIEDTDEAVSLKWTPVLIAPDGGLPS